MEELPPSQRPGSSFEALGDDDPVFATDDFRMFAMKVTPCTKRFVHDWVTCPLSHPGEKAKRRDPRKSGYTGIACPAMKKAGMCHRGDQCPYAHNVFEYWLHPTRYRTQLCNDGMRCRRRVCFFAHTLEELRVPSTKPFVAPEALAVIDQAASSNASPQHGAAVQGQMLGPTLAPEQQEALMHILMALQQSGEALPPQDLDTVQAEGRRLEQLYSVNASDPFTGIAPASLHTTSGGSLHAGRYNNNNINSSVSAHSGSAASAHSGYSSRMASLNASSYGVPTAALSASESLGTSEADAIQALNYRLASLQRSGGSGEDREAVVGLLQRMLSGGLGTPPLQSHSSAGSRDFDAEMAGMIAANGGYGGLHQSSSPHYSVGSGSMNKFSPDPRAYLASSLYAPSGATSAYQVSPARSSRVSSEYDRSGQALQPQGRLSLQEDMRPLPDGGTGYNRRRSLQQVDDWRMRPGILNSYGTVNPAGTAMPQQLSLQQQQQSAMLLNGGNGDPNGGSGGPRVAGYGHHEEAMATPFHGGRPSNAVPQWQWPAQYPHTSGPVDAAAVASMRAALSAPGSVHASSSGSGYEVRFSGEFPRVQAAMGRSDSLLEGLQEHPPTLNIHPLGSSSPPRESPQPDTHRSGSSAARSSPGIASLVDQFQDLQTGATASPQQRFVTAPALASPSGHSRPPMPPGTLGFGRMSFDFARAPGDGRRMSLSGMLPSGSRSPSMDLGGSLHPTLSLQGLQQSDQGSGQGTGADRPGSAQSA